MQEQPSLNSLDTTVLHKDEKQPKKEIGPYFGFGVSAAPMKNLSVLLVLFFILLISFLH